MTTISTPEIFDGSNFNIHIAPALYILASSFVFAVGCRCVAQASSTPGTEPNAEASYAVPTDPQGAHLHVDQVTMPIIVVKGYPFIEATVHGTQGKLLFDVGSPASFELNSHKVDWARGIPAGMDHFGSGQSVAKMTFPEADLTLSGGIRFENLQNVGGIDGLQLEQHITPDFIGWLGLEFWTGYLAKLDYQRPSVTFYRNDAGGAAVAAAEAGEHLVQTVHFDNQLHRQLANFLVKIGTVQFLATLDTGAHTTAWLDAKEISELKEAGTLHDKAGGHYEISGMTIDGNSVAPMELSIEAGTDPVAKLMPRSDLYMITLGYEFLSQYKTLWDYRRNTLTLLQR